MMRLVVIGTGDTESMKLESLGRRAVARCGSAGVSFDYVAVGARDKINGVDQLPALCIDGRVVAQGRVPRFRDIQTALTEAITSTVEDLSAPTPSTSESATSISTVRQDIPFCDGCGRGCSLATPGCRVGRRKAHERGITPRN